MDNSSYGYGDFNVNTVAAFQGITNQDGSPTGVPSTAALTLNANGAFFTSKDANGNPWLVGARGYDVAHCRPKLLF